MTIENTVPANLAGKLVDKDFETAKQQYRDMVKTKAYADFKNSADVFIAKLNLNMANFATKSQWMAWINSNISSTTFASVAQFEILYDSMYNKMGILRSNNAGLYNYMDNADNSQYYQILQPSFNFVPILNSPSVPTSCINNCQNAHGSAINATVAQYNAVMDQALNHQNLLGNAILQYMASYNYNQAEVNLALQYNACVGGC